MYRALGQIRSAWCGAWSGASLCEARSDVLVRGTVGRGQDYSHTSTTPQPRTNRSCPRHTRATQGRARPRRGRDAAPQGQAQRQTANECPAAPWGGGRGRGAPLSEAHWGSTGQRYQDRCAGRLKRRPTTCCTPATKQVEHHDIQEGRRLHLREQKQRSARRKRREHDEKKRTPAPLRGRGLL